ncbi:MAG: M20/M25/M40 family metallo-hydrolase [Anaerolineae bacterium]|nr:M20/M25/M40 family metallo-hydrolase [Anaerolineae bacterium]
MSDTPPTLQVSVVTPTPAELSPVPPTRELPTEAALSRPFDPSVSDLLNDVQSDRLMYAVFTLASFNTRHVLSSTTNSAQGIGAARDWLITQWTAMRSAYPNKQIQIWTQPVNYQWKTYTIATENVVAVFPGTEIGAGVIVVGAHYDSITTDWENGAAYAPGANDNGSGIAALLEIGHIMARRPHRATIIFVAFTAEETGKQGSETFAQAYLKANNVDVRAMINLDIIGSEYGPNDELDRRTVRLFSADPNDSVSRQLARQIALITSTYIDDMTLVLQSSEERRGRWGDHQSFSAAGYPAIRIIQGQDNLARQHTGRDTPDGVQAAYLTRVTRLVLATVKVLADGLPAPTDLRLTTRANDPQTLTLSWSPVPAAASYLIVLRKMSSLSFDQVLTVGNVAQLQWVDITKYNTVALASVDAKGQMGVLSSEYAIQSLLGR